MITFITPRTAVVCFILAHVALRIFYITSRYLHIVVGAVSENTIPTGSALQHDNTKTIATISSSLQH